MDTQTRSFSNAPSPSFPVSSLINHGVSQSWMLWKLISRMMTLEKHGGMNRREERRRIGS
jgi:hypothetical protein